MAMNRIQFQPGWSMPAFLEQFGTEPQAEAALEKARWPQVFRCPRCGQADPCVLHLGAAKPFQCQSCRLQPSLSAGTWCQNTHLALPVWFLAIYLVSPAKTGLSALGLMRQLGISYPTAWLLHHKLRQARAERDAPYTLGGQVQVDAAYLGGELAGSKAGRGSENQVPFVAAVALTAAGQAVYTTMAPVPGFTRTAIAAWAKTDLSPGGVVVSDGLACFAGVTDLGGQHQPVIGGARNPQALPEFSWITTVLGNLKTSFGGAYQGFDLATYGTRYLAAFAYRVNRRFPLKKTLPMHRLAAAVALGPRPEPWLRRAEESC